MAMLIYVAITIALIAICATETDALSRSGAHVCSRSQQRRVSYRQEYSVYSKEKYYKKCGWTRCARYRSNRSTRYRTQYRTEYYATYECCQGWMQVRSYDSSCSRPICNSGCQNGGECTSPNRCTCAGGYGGDRCQTPICSPRCGNGGTCQSPGRCSCRSGYTGNRCQTSICSPTCKNGGSCVRPGVCSCTSVYRGNRCETPICTPSCRNSGRCVNPNECECTRQYTGNICQTPICSPSCEHGGSCVSPDECACIRGFVGAVCQEVVSITCPEDITVPNWTNVDYAIVIWKEPVAEGGNGLIEIIPTHYPGLRYVLGSTPVTYSVTDEIDARIVTSCTFFVNVEDTESPLVICPRDILRVIGPGETATISWRPPIWHDNSGIATLSSDHRSGQSFEGGRAVVSYEAVDPSGNSNNCSFDVNVEEIRLICQDDINIPVDGGPGVDRSLVITWEFPTVIGLDEGVLEITSTRNSGSEFNIGVTQVVYSAIDSNNDVVTECRFNVNIEVVTIICPATISVPNQYGVDYAEVVWNEPSVQGGAGFTRTNASHVPGTMFELGRTTVTYRVYSTDDQFVTQCNFTVEVLDNEVPTITCPLNVSTSLVARGHNANVTWIFPDAYDNSGYLTVTSSYNPGDTFAPGNTLVVYDAVDPAGNANSCCFNVSVEVVIIICPEDIDIQSKCKVDFASVDWSEPLVQGGEGAIRVTSSYLPGSRFKLGSTKVSYSVLTKIHDLVTSCSFDVTVVDLEDPTLICPKDVNVLVGRGKVPHATWRSLMYFDNSGLLTVTSSHKSGDIQTHGNTVVQCIAVDPSGNMANCTFNVNITEVYIHCPADIYKPLDGSLTSTMIFWEPPKAVGGDGSVNVTASQAPRTEFPVGATIVTYSVFDHERVLVTACNFTVLIQSVVLICSADIEIATDTGRNYSSQVTWDLPSIDGGEVYVKSVSSSHNADQKYYIGTTTVMYDARGYDDVIVTNCSFTLTVLDTEKPSLICPTDIMLFTDASSLPAITYASPNVTDNSGHVSNNCTYASADVFPSGTSLVQCVAWDPYDNENTCSFEIHVEGVSIVCPDDVRTVIDKGSTRGTVTWPYPEVHGGLNQINITGSYHPGDDFPIGIFSVEYIVYGPDSSPITACNFTVVVFDPDIPTVICPNDIFELTESNTTKLIHWDMPAILDYSGTGRLTYQSHTPGILFMEGTTVVRYEATDFMGKTGHCNFSVTVTGVTIICPDNINTTTDLGSAFANVTWNAPEVIGGEDFVEINVTEQLWQLFPIGDTSITYDVPDADAGVVTNCSFLTHVEDLENPTIVCPNNTLVYVDPSMNASSVFWTTPVVSDNSGAVAAITSTRPSGAVFPIGCEDVLCSVEDPSGNGDECQFVVCVEEVRLVCPSDFSVTSGPGFPFSSNVSWSLPILQGGEDHIHLTSNRQSGDSFNIGNHTIIYSALSSGPIFSTMCQFTVSIYDTEPPLVQCPPNTTLNLPSGTTSMIVLWDSATASDNTGSVELISNHKSGDIFRYGTTNVRYEASDPSGNIAECNFSVTIKALCINNTSTVFGGIVSWFPTPSDNIAESHRRCPIDTANNKRSFATRLCSFDERFGALWEDPLLVDCGAVIVMTLDDLTEVSVDQDNVIEVAAELAVVTDNMTSITSHDVIKITQIIQNIIDMRPDLPLVSSALAQTASTVIATESSTSCYRTNIDDMLIKSLLPMLKLFEIPYALTSISEDLNLQSDRVSVRGDESKVKSHDSTRHNIMRLNGSSRQKVLGLTGSGRMHFGTTDSASLVTADLFLKEDCVAPNSSMQSVQTILSVYDTQTNHLTVSSSVGWTTSVIVSPLAIVHMAGSHCSNLSKQVEIRLPVNLSNPDNTSVMVNNSVKCVLLDMYGDDDRIRQNESDTDDGCETGNVTSANDVTCVCQHLGVYAVTVDFICTPAVSIEEDLFTLGWYDSIGCYIVVVGLFISVFLVLSKRMWLLPLHQHILFHLYVSMLCTYCVFLLIGHMKILLFGCELIGNLLHYFVLTTMIWFAVEAQGVYVSAMMMGAHDPRYFIWICSAVAWLLPAIVVAPTAWLTNEDGDNTNTCIDAETVFTRFTLTIPGGMILLHNIIVYSLAARRLLKTTGYFYAFHRRICLRFGEVICIFIITLINMIIAYYMVVVSSDLSRRVVFFVSCLVEALSVLGVNFWRVFPRPGRSGKYKVDGAVKVNYESSSDEEETDPDVNFYFSSPFELFEMDDFDQKRIAKQGNGNFTSFI